MTARRDERSALKPPLTSERERTVVMLGEAPNLSSYFADLRARGLPIEFASHVDDRTVARLRLHRRAVVIVGVAMSLGTLEQTALIQLRQAGAVLVSAAPGVDHVGDIPVVPLLPWPNVAWFVVETYRRFCASADGRIVFARERLARNDGREWLAEALMVCPNAIDDSASLLGLSGPSLSRRMRRYGVTWHTLCDRLVLNVCVYQSRMSAVKASAMAEELGFLTASAMSRRLRRLGGAGWRQLGDH